MAGIIDGDGCLTISKHPHYEAVIQFVNESRQLMNWAVLHFGGYYRKESIPSGKDFYRWIMNGKLSKRKFIDTILPFLSIKRSQAEILREFLKIEREERNPEKRETFLLAIREARKSSSVETDTQVRLSDKLLYAYAAGLIDTDGHIGVRTVKSGEQMGCLRIRIEVVNTHKATLEYLGHRFGGYVIHKNTPSPWTPRHRWLVTDKKSQEKLFLALLPYLIVKRDKAKQALNLVRSGALKIQPDTTGNSGREPAETLAS